MRLIPSPTLGTAKICSVRVPRWAHGFIALAILATGCGAAPETQPPALRIVEPAHAAALTANQESVIRLEYDGAQFVNALVWVNGERLAVLPMPAKAQASTSWTPPAAGRYVLYAEARDAEDRIVARSDAVVINVQPPVAATDPAPAALSSPTPEPSIAPTATAVVLPTETAVATPTPAPTPTPGVVVTNAFVNLRAGPGTSYALLGRLTQGQAAEVTGKSDDGQWWQVRVENKVAWVAGRYVQPNESAGLARIVPPPALPTAAPTTVALVALAPTATEPPAPQPTPTPSEPPCDPSNPYWAARLNNAPDYTFCTPVPFEFVPNASPDPDELVIRWHIYGIKSLELRIDPSGDECGMGTRGLRQPVPFKMDDFRINRRHWPPGGYKIGLFATLHDGRVQDWGELHFCGK